ncbi:MAG: gamma-glutamyl-gamma-aminobutyrate hydrolase family protein [Anaerolineae bacterium]|nr:gamma-glutamyl-gamma-aminobutyrate hydrolase family protein [Anaerolineae bacterium]
MTRTRPLIGCSTYRRTLGDTQPIDMFGLMSTYTEAVGAAGGLPMLIPLGLTADELLALVQRLDGILLPGGGDIAPAEYGGDESDQTVRSIDPDRDALELWLARYAAANDVPLLAICRGIQVVNVALGGSLWEDIYQSMPGAIVHDYNSRNERDYLAHDVTVAPGSCLAGVLQTSDPIPVNSLHHQGIRRLATGLTTVATAPDGLIEAVELRDHPFALAVQWHPEAMLERVPLMRRLFRGFVQAAGG